MDKRKILLVQEPNMQLTHIHEYITTWNDTHETDDQFFLYVDPDLTAHPDASVWLINVELDNSWFELVQQHLRLQPDMNICFFIEPQELRLFSYIKQLDDDFPFANIGTIVKPCQYNRVEQFLSSVKNKRGMVVFDDDWDNMDFNDIE